MVGRQTSRGCATCRRRKVKCDLVSPECSGCVRAGTQCPGYFDRFVEVQTSQCARGAKRLRPEGRADVGLSAVTMCSRIDHLRAEFVNRLEQGRLAARLYMMPTSNILKHVPSRIGGSRALDDAVRCVVHGTSSPSFEERIEARRLYGVALSSLRDAIEHPVHARLPATTAAASLLQMHEEYTNPRGRESNYHAYGTFRLLEARGIDNMTDELEGAILDAQAGCTFLSSLIANEEGLLTYPAWLAVRIPTTKIGKFLDHFVQKIVDEESVPDMDALAAEVCGLQGRMEPDRLERLTSLAIRDIMPIRQHLKSSLDNARVLDDSTQDALDSQIVMRTAVQFFIFFLDSLSLSLRVNLLQKFKRTLPPFPDELPEHELQEERHCMLAGIKSHFQQLSQRDSRTRLIVPGAFRVILGILLGLRQAGHSEPQVLLALLDQASQAQWPWKIEGVPLVQLSAG